MSDDEQPTFETTESGASQTYPQQAGEIRKGSYLMIKGHPCKCTEVSTSKTGKHGHAKAHIVALDIFTGKKYEDLCPSSHNLDVPFVKRNVALDIFTGKKYEDLCPSSHNLDVPFVKRIEYQLLAADPETGEVSLLLESGMTKDDLNLPTFVKVGEPTEDDKKVVEEILKAVEDGKEIIVIVQSACGEEKIIQAKISDPK
eukprot:CAMPEP_0183599960 /NCGR_PEP_ID=MMETSP0371-20130417/179695_1 /TAXON_ID=268820 /ORGANISM="Peridinium aciculiferum, Strain PAER-2" /LENGTH=199 /DNA_ID=CAMNT_0025812031 /DNA_START=60 /DNA_END=660 /DNA_ORIENTATION=+